MIYCEAKADAESPHVHLRPPPVPEKAVRAWNDRTIEALDLEVTS